MRRAVTLIVLLLAVGGAAYWWFEIRVPPTATAQGGGRRGVDTAPVVVATAETRDVPVWLDGLGTVQASAMVTVKPMVDGPLLEMRFKEGQDVKSGDVLARIDPRPYQAALDQATAKKAQDEANLANARLDLVRYQKLAATAYTSAQQADTQRATVAQLEAQVAQDQAQIDNARTQLSYTTITAPVDGRVGIRQVDAGNIVHASDAAGLVVLTTLRPISVVFTLPQQSLPAVARAIEAAQPTGHGAEVLALPQDANGNTNGAGASAGTGSASGARRQLDRGELTVLDNQVDPTTGTIKLKATFPNQGLALWPGAFVTVRLRADTLKAATTVPPVAVQRGPRGTYVFVLAEGSTAARRTVTVAHEDLASAVIASGLSPGEQVVVDGAARLSDGMKVNVIKPEGAAADTPVAGEQKRPAEGNSRGTSQGPSQGQRGRRGGAAPG